MTVWLTQISLQGAGLGRHSLLAGKPYVQRGYFPVLGNESRIEAARERINLAAVPLAPGSWFLNLTPWRGAPGSPHRNFRVP